MKAEIQGQGIHATDRSHAFTAICPLLWRFGSACARATKSSSLHALLAPWPVERPRNWAQWLNQPQTEAELAALRLSRDRGRPYGDEQWTARIAKRLNIESSLRPVGRPRKREDGNIGL